MILSVGLGKDMSDDDFDEGIITLNLGGFMNHQPVLRHMFLVYKVYIPRTQHHGNPRVLPQCHNPRNSRPY